MSEESNGNTNELISVIQVFRHGHRTPGTTYTDDPNPPDSWGSTGLAELTHRGKREVYELGNYTRTRYSKLLPTHYSSKDFQIYSTDVDRTITSAQLLAAGLYPSCENEIWNENLKWNPIPVREADPFVFAHLPEVPIPLFKQILRGILEDELYPKYRDVLDQLRHNVGRKMEPYEMIMFFDKWEIEQSSGRQIPAWAEECFPRLEQFSFDFVESFTRSNQLKRMVVGSFFHDLVDHFSKISGNPLLGPKLITYAGHDLNIISILKTLGLYESRYRPPSACSLFFELKQSNRETYLNIYYKTYDGIIPLSIPGADFDITLEDFKKYFISIIVDKNVMIREASVIS